MSIDVKLLIEQVEQRPPLWDRQNSCYFNKRLVTKMWDDIAASHGVHPGVVKTKWKGLRDTFRLELRKNEKSTWTFYRNMQFLRHHIKSRALMGQNGNGDGVVDIDRHGFASFKDEPMENVETSCVFLSEYDDQDNSVSLDGNNSTNGDAKDSTERLDDTSLLDKDQMKDDDYHFLMSFLPEMRKLDSKKKMLLRIKMMELFYKETYDPHYKRC